MGELGPVVDTPGCRGTKTVLSEEVYRRGCSVRPYGGLVRGTKAGVVAESWEGFGDGTGDGLDGGKAAMKASVGTPLLVIRVPVL